MRARYDVLLVYENYKPIASKPVLLKQISSKVMLGSWKRGRLADLTHYTKWRINTSLNVIIGLDNGLPPDRRQAFI